MRPFKIAVERNMLNGVTDVKFSFTGDPAEPEVPHLMQLQYGSDATAQLRALARLCVSLIEAAEKEGKIARELQEANRLMNMQDQKNWGGLASNPLLSNPNLLYKSGKNNGP